MNALCKAKNGRFTGNGAYSIYLVKYHNHAQLYNALTMLRGECFNCRVPKMVNSMLIMPLHKHKGSKHDLDNNRGISLIDPLCKLLVAVVIAKLEQYAQEQYAP